MSGDCGGSTRARRARRRECCRCLRACSVKAFVPFDHSERPSSRVGARCRIQAPRSGAGERASRLLPGEGNSGSEHRNPWKGRRRDRHLHSPIDDGLLLDVVPVAGVGENDLGHRVDPGGGKLSLGVGDHRLRVSEVRRVDRHSAGIMICSAVTTACAVVALHPGRVRSCRWLTLPAMSYRGSGGLWQQQLRVLRAHRHHHSGIRTRTTTCQAMFSSMT